MITLSDDDLTYDLDLGRDHYLAFTCWKPDRELNPQYVHLPDIEKVGALIRHPAKGTGERCIGYSAFDIPNSPETPPRWTVESWEPLTLSPSIQCSCGDHGFIREGRWVPA